MWEMYQDKLNRLENEYRYWVRLANEETIKSGSDNYKQKLVYLQHAADICSEMASCSRGAAGDHYRRMINDIQSQMTAIIKENDPGYFERVRAANGGGSKPAAGSSGSSGSAGASGNKAAEKGTIKATSVDPETVKKWHKDIPQITFEKDVQGMQAEKDRMLACAKDTSYINLKQYLGIDKNKSYILYGPPGTGKTHLVNAFVHELSTLKENFTFLSVDSSDILSKYVGDAEKLVTALFEEAIKCAPSIIFIDELDGVCKNRSMKNLPEYASSITTSFLTAYNGLKSSKDQVIFIGATNYPANIDKAMLDRVELIHISYPDAEPRIGKFKRDIGEAVALTDGFTYEEIGQLTETPTFNYRDLDKLYGGLKDLLIKELVAKYSNESAAIEALKSGAYGINRELFVKALEEYPPQDHSVSDEEIKLFETGIDGDGEAMQVVNVKIVQ